MNNKDVQAAEFDHSVFVAQPGYMEAVIAFMEEVLGWTAEPSVDGQPWRFVQGPNGIRFQISEVDKPVVPTIEDHEAFWMPESAIDQALVRVFNWSTDRKLKKPEVTPAGTSGTKALVKMDPQVFGTCLELMVRA